MHPLTGKKQTFEHIEKRRMKLIGRKLSAEHRKKISEFQKGKKHSEETKLKIGQKSLGHTLSAESRKKISETRKARISEGKINLKYSPEIVQKRADVIRGYRHTDEYKIKISENWHLQHPPESRKGRPKGMKHSEETKKIIREKRLHQVFPVQDTSIELKLQALLTMHGITFSTHKPIEGQPDIFIEPNICIFADGCFWHGCDQCFEEKDGRMRKQKVCDLLIEQKLVNDGYKVIRFWEHDINRNMGKIFQRLQIHSVIIK